MSNETFTTPRPTIRRYTDADAVDHRLAVLELERVIARIDDEDALRKRRAATLRQQQAGEETELILDNKTFMRLYNDAMKMEIKRADELTAAQERVDRRFGPHTAAPPVEKREKRTLFEKLAEIVIGEVEDPVRAQITRTVGAYTPPVQPSTHVARAQAWHQYDKLSKMAVKDNRARELDAGMSAAERPPIPWMNG
jgi:hypothetical protein